MTPTLFQRVTDPDTPGVWRVIAIGTKRSVNLKPGSVLLWPEDADAELYLLSIGAVPDWMKIVRWVEDLRPVLSPAPTAGPDPPETDPSTLF